MIRPFRRRLLNGVAILASLSFGACSKDSPTEPPTQEADLVAVSGNGQFGPAGQFLIDPLTVSVRRITDGQPVEDAFVEWTVVEGSGAQLDPSSSQSDTTGLATARLRLGAGLGRYLIHARLRAQPERFVELEAWAVLPPELRGLSAGNANAGEVVTLDGDNFSAIASHNVVLFSGIRGSVVAAEPTSLAVEVPPCLPTATVDVSVRLGGEASGALPLGVQAASDEAFDPEFGADTTIVIGDGPSCLRLAPGNWLAVAQATSTIGAARFDYTFTGLRESSSTSAARRAPSRGKDTVFEPGTGVTRERWKVFLRGLEEDFLARRRSSRERPLLAPTARAPQVGDRRTFNVVRADGEFDQVTAEVRLVSGRALLYVDVEAQGSLSQNDVEGFGSVFDDPIYTVDAGAFGQVSDVDANDKVIILFTPGVNRLTPPSSGEFVGGFFFGLDLITDAENGNAAEIFYVMVPDPTGQYGNVHSTDLVRSSVPAILAHELQHMIHHNERIIQRGGERSDALWLSEGLAQMAEDLVGEELRRRGSDEADDFQRGNWQRANRFLEDPADVSLIVATGQGTLEERGAGWLFVRYLRDQAGTDAVLSALTQTVLTGIDNVETVTGRAWEDLFPDWSAAIAVEAQLSGSGELPVRSALQFPGVDLVQVISDGVGSFELKPTVITVGDFSAEARLWSSSGAYFLLGSGEGGLAVSLAGSGGGAAPPQAGLRLKLVRLF